MERTVKAIDLFCGAGGFSLGMFRAGYNVIAGIDNWLPALETYRANFNHPAIEFDLAETTTAIAEIRELYPRMIFGSPPCQDFSLAGERREGERADLTKAFAYIVAGVKPPYALMENVAVARHSTAWGWAMQILYKAGYRFWANTIDAAYCGVPQHRHRAFLLAYRKDIDLELQIDSYIHRKQSTHPLTPREYMGDELTEEHYFYHVRTYGKRGVYSIDEPSATIRGQTLRNPPPGYKRNPKDAVEPSTVRGLTAGEIARIQTFPVSYIWPEYSKATLNQLIGNAVPPALGEFVGRAILSAIDDATN